MSKKFYVICALGLLLTFALPFKADARSKRVQPQPDWRREELERRERERREQLRWEREQEEAEGLSSKLCKKFLLRYEREAIHKFHVEVIQGFFPVS